MPTLFQENKTLIRFLLTCLLGYIAWFIGYTLWLEPSQIVDSWLSRLEAKEITLLLQTLGFDISLVLEDGYKYAFYLRHTRTVGLANNCNGLVLFPLFSLFIVATPGQWKTKLMYILVGCLAIYHLNILRIISLIFIKDFYPESLEFNHKYTFTVAMYAFIFFLWHLWVKHFSQSKPTSNV